MLLADINTNAAFDRAGNAIGTLGSAPSDFTVANRGKTLFFTANAGATGRELYTIELNGLAAGATLLQDIAPASFVGSDPRDLTRVGEEVYFSVDPGTRTRQLWKSDGTAQATAQVSGADLATDGLTEFQGELWFAAGSDPNAPRDDYQLWNSDGTFQGTQRLADASLLDRQLAVSIIPVEGDGSLRADDGAAPGLLARTVDLNAVSGANPIAVDLTEAFREVLEVGFTRVTVRVELLGPPTASALTIRSARDPSASTGLHVTTVPPAGVVGDLLDDAGGLLIEGGSIFDLRTLEAGTFYLRVYNPFEAVQADALPFQVEVSAPKSGFTHPGADRDFIIGDDGEDILIGGKQADQLLGAAGADVFFGETNEVRDLAVGEFSTAAIEAEKITPSQFDLRPLDPVVEFGDPLLEAALAEVLGEPVTTSFLGTALIHEPLTVTDLSGLDRLDLAELGLTDLTGLRFATNLRSVNLSGNLLSDIFELVPGTAQSGDAVGSPIGAAGLQYLALDDNLLFDLEDVRELPELLGLSLDGNPVSDLSPLESPEGLRFLSVDGPYQLTPELPGTALYDGFGLLGDIPVPFVTTGDGFGSALAALGQNMVVGAPFTDLVASNSGRAYLINGRSGEVMLGFNNPSAAAGDNFGSAVGVIGRNVLIGAPQDDTVASNAGAAYLFDGGSGALRKTFLNPVVDPNSDFGEQVASVNGKVLIAAPDGDDPSAANAGVVYLFDPVTGALLQTFRNPTPLGGDDFGGAIAAVNGKVLIGAPGDDTGAANAGSAYLFNAETGALLQTFHNPSPGSSDRFGSDVAARGNDVLISAPFDDTGASSAGAVYLFDGNSGALIDTLTNPTPATNEFFGQSIIAVGDNVLIGADRANSPTVNAVGEAYLFDGDNGQLLHTFQNPTPAGFDFFGGEVAALGTSPVIAAHSDDVPGLHAGTIYVFEGVQATDVSPLVGLTSLEVLSLARQQVEDIKPLAAMDSLTHLYLQDNRIAEADTLLGVQLADNASPSYTESGKGWVGGENEEAVEENYRLHPGSDPLASATWTFPGLVDGTYEVFATWPAHDSRTVAASYTLFDGPVEKGARLVNQRLAPIGRNLGAASWTSLGAISIETGTLAVELSAAGEGHVVADAIHLLRVDPVTREPLALVNHLRRVTLEQNPLDNFAHTILRPALFTAVSDDSATLSPEGVSFDPNSAAPRISPVAPQSVLPGNSIDVDLSILNPDSDPVFFEVFSDSGSVSVSVAGQTVTVAADANFQGTARITVIASDGPSGPADTCGRSDTIGFDVSAGVGAAYGTQFHDLDKGGDHDKGEPGLEGVTIYLDENRRCWA